nr:formin-like protein 6 isoform X2 [Ipomoea batatas]
MNFRGGNNNTMRPHHLRINLFSSCCVVVGCRGVPPELRLPTAKKNTEEEEFCISRCFPAAPPQGLRLLSAGKSRTLSTQTRRSSRKSRIRAHSSRRVGSAQPFIRCRRTRVFCRSNPGRSRKVAIAISVGICHAGNVFRVGVFIIYKHRRKHPEDTPRSWWVGVGSSPENRRGIKNAAAGDFFSVTLGTVEPRAPDSRNSQSQKTTTDTRARRKSSSDTAFERCDSDEMDGIKPQLKPCTGTTYQVNHSDRSTGLGPAKTSSSPEIAEGTGSLSFLETFGEDGCRTKEERNKASEPTKMNTSKLGICREGF